jgi:hypothetical protein
MVTPGRLAAGVLGLGLTGGGVALGWGSAILGPVLLSLGAVLLLVGFALPLVSQIELGAPLLLRATLAVDEQQDRMRQFTQDCRGLLTTCAVGLCLDPEAAARAVESTVSQVLTTWRGTDPDLLRVYLMCVLVQQSEFEARTGAIPLAPPIAAPAGASGGSVLATPMGGGFLRLGLREREVLLLRDRAGLDVATVARILGMATADVPVIAERAAAALSVRGTP